MTATIKDLTGPQLVAVFNAISDSSITRFASRDIAHKRIRGAIAAAGMTEVQALRAGGIAVAEPAPAPAPEPAKAPKTEPKPAGGKRAQIEAAADAGVLPEPPDFTAETHAPYRKKLAALVAMVEARDVAGLTAFEIKPYSSSPKALDRYRNLAVRALRAQAKA
jgi:hypothetical protein